MCRQYTVLTLNLGPEGFGTDPWKWDESDTMISRKRGAQVLSSVKPLPTHVLPDPSGPIPSSTSFHGVLPPPHTRRVDEMSPCVLTYLGVNTVHRESSRGSLPGVHCPNVRRTLGVTPVGGVRSDDDCTTFEGAVGVRRTRKYSTVCVRTGREAHWESTVWCKDGESPQGPVCGTVCMGGLTGGVPGVVRDGVLVTVSGSTGSDPSRPDGSSLPPLEWWGRFSSP